MVNLEEARKMAVAARRAVLMGKAPRNVKVALMATSMIKLEQELTRIETAIKKHYIECYFFQPCCRAAVKPKAPAGKVVEAPGGTA